MARIYHTGAEWQVISELSAVTGFAIDTTHHYGSGSAASFGYSGTIADTAQVGFSYPIPAISATKLFVKQDIFIDSFPDSGEDFSFRPMDFRAVADNSLLVRVIIYNEGGVLKLEAQYNNGATQSATLDLSDSDMFILDSSILDGDDVLIYGGSEPVMAGAWFTLEMCFDSTPADGHETFEVRVNGLTRLYEDDLTYGQKSVKIGSTYLINNTGSSQSAAMYIDNIAINTGDGSYNNSWIGEEYIVPLVPTGAGDSNGTAGDWSQIDEIPATTSYASGNFVSLVGNNLLAQFTITDPTTYMSPADKINAVTLPAYIVGPVSGTPSYRTQIKGSSGGTAQQSGAFTTASDGTTRPSPNNTTAWAGLFISEYDPATNTPWKVVGTSSLSNAQIGVAGTSSGNRGVTAFVAMVAYTPRAQTTGAGMLGLFW